MNDKETGGPAFPHKLVYPNDTYYHAGMTLRDWFAGQTLVGILGNPNVDNLPGHMFAKAAYEIADAMIEARK